MKRSYAPRGWLKNPHIQSVLASSGLRGFQARRRFPDLLSAQREVLLDCGEGVRLTGLLALQPDSAARPSRGLVIMIHGWEGSVQSSYLVSTGGHLYADGFDVFRLNLRDHGNTHSLNVELFHSCRLAEVVGAVKAILAQVPHQRAMLGGFSLGGNFALRVARALPDAFSFVFSVCPPLVPKNSLEAIGQSPWFYQAYFMRKWTESLKRKEKLYPERYNFASWKGLSMPELTRALIAEHTDFPTLDSYLDGYCIGSDRLLSLKVPTLIIASVDDPVIPVADFYQLQRPATMALEILENGGHCGFLLNAKLESYIESRISAALAHF
jgi:uncharacterized protein